MELALAIAIGVLLVAVLYLNRAARNKNRQRDQLYREVAAENTARLHAQVSDFASLGKADLTQAIQTIQRQRGTGAGWDAALKAAFPKISSIQLTRLRGDILAVAQTGKSEREAVEIVVRRLVKPAGR